MKSGSLIKTVAGVALVAAAGVGGVVSALGPQRPAATAGRAATVGALFALRQGGALGPHFCTASVVDSPSGDLVLTAAHCVASKSVGAVGFVPGYDHGRRPAGVWVVTRVLMDPRWTSSADPDDDFAFLVVSQRGARHSLQQVTGAETIGIGVSGGGRVQVAGYPDGRDSLISCDNTARAYTRTQLEFDCAGFTDGTSGSPLLASAGSARWAGMVIGVIGGYQQGGDSPAVSYAARFGPDMAALYRSAIAIAGS